MRPSRQADPFSVLGLNATPGLTDDEVRSAWRRIAAATHPDRADSGDPARFAAAAAAYTTLRTRFGRAEAFADLPRAGVPGRPGPAGRAEWGRAQSGGGRRVGVGAERGGGKSRARGRGEQSAGAGKAEWSRVRAGRPVRLALRIAAAVVASVACVLAAGAGPGTLALITGVLTWLVLTARRDLAPPVLTANRGREEWNAGAGEAERRLGKR